MCNFVENKVTSKQIEYRLASFKTKRLSSNFEKNDRVPVPVQT